MSIKIDWANSMVGRVWMSAACVGLALVWGQGKAVAQAQPEKPVGEVATDDDDDDSRPWFHGTTEEQRGRARDLFLEGNELIAFPSYARAAANYQAAIEIWDNPAFHYNLAIAQINLLRPTEAYSSLKQAVRHGAAPLGEDKHQQALDYMASLEAQLTRLRITCDQRHVMVFLDGRPLFVGPGIYVDYVQPGGHQLMATKDGYDTESRELVASPGEPLEVDVHLFKPDEIVTVRRWSAWKPWAVVGAGAAFLGVSGYLDHRTSVEFNQLDSDFEMLCPVGCQEGQVPSQFRDQLASARSRQNIALITYAAGGALLVTGAVLLYVNRERVVHIKGDRESPYLSVTPISSPTMAGLQASFRF